MSAVDVITAAGAAVGIITGGAGVVLAVRADSRAKKANQNAQTANSIAEEANRIAEDANQFARESNAITQRQAAQQNEHWVVHWSPGWDRKGAALILTNTGSHCARQPSVIVRGPDIHDVHDELHDVDPGHKLTLPVPEIVEQRRKHLQENQRVTSNLAAQGVTYGAKGFGRSLTITVTWRTGADAIRQEVVQQKVT